MSRLAIGDDKSIKTMDKSGLVIDFMCLSCIPRKLIDCVVLTFEVNSHFFILVF